MRVLFKLNVDFKTLKKHNFKSIFFYNYHDTNISSQIKNGRPFPISLIGAGILPDLHFSFKHHDFGPCFLYEPGMSHQKTTLIVTNQDIRDISIDCLYQSVSTNLMFLEVTSKPCVIPAGKRTEVTFSFYPRQIMKYRETVTFLVNGLSTVEVVISGQGTELRVSIFLLDIIASYST